MAEQDLAAAAAAVLSAGRTSAFARPAATTAATATTPAAPSRVPSSSVPAPAPAPLEIALFAQLAQLAAPPHGIANGLAMQQAAAIAAAMPLPALFPEPHHHHPAASAPAAPLIAVGGAGGAPAAAANGATTGGGRTRSGESRMSTTYASRHQLAEQRRRNRINER